VNTVNYNWTNSFQFEFLVFSSKLQHQCFFIDLYQNSKQRCQLAKYIVANYERDSLACGVSIFSSTSYFFKQPLKLFLLLRKLGGPEPPCPPPWLAWHLCSSWLLDNDDPSCMAGSDGYRPGDGSGWNGDRLLRKLYRGYWCCCCFAAAVSRNLDCSDGLLRVCCGVVDHFFFHHPIFRK